MGLRPTQRNESRDVTPAKAGVHLRKELDSRFRGNDVTFDGEARNLALILPLQPTPLASFGFQPISIQDEIPRSARNDSRV
jgi:hypothetical protein